MELAILKEPFWRTYIPIGEFSRMYLLTVSERSISRFIRRSWDRYRDSLISASKTVGRLRKLSTLFMT